MGDKRTVKIFVASSGEMVEEREEFYRIIAEVNKHHKHLHLDVIEWEVDMGKGSFPGFENIQAAINPKLKESDFMVFLFYSKLGVFTKEEFDLAREDRKKVFVYFKKGFSPEEHEIEAYDALLKFKKSMSNTVIKEHYKDMVEFEKLLFPALSLYLGETYPVLDIEKVKEENVRLSSNVMSLLQILTEKDKRIKALEEGDDDGSELAQLIGERDALQQELLQNKEIQKQQAQDKKALEQQLGLQKEHDGLKAKALEEVEKGNYDEAEHYLKERAKESIEETATTFYELGKIKKLQFKYKEAFVYYELAVKNNDENSFYLNEAGLMASNLGYYDKANDLFERALGIDVKYYGEEHLALAIRYNNLGLAYRSKGEYDKAIYYYEMALTIGRKYYGEQHPDIATEYNNLASAYIYNGEYNIAIEYYDKALILLYKFFPEDHPYISISQKNLQIAKDALNKK